MISQKGFMSVANEFGLRLGYTKDQVLDLANSKGVEIAEQISNEKKYESETDPFDKERVLRLKNNFFNK